MEQLEEGGVIEECLDKGNQQARNIMGLDEMEVQTEPAPKRAIFLDVPFEGGVTAQAPAPPPTPPDALPRPDALWLSVSGSPTDCLASARGGVCGGGGGGGGGGESIYPSFHRRVGGESTHKYAYLYITFWHNKHSKYIIAPIVFESLAF